MSDFDFHDFHKHTDTFRPPDLIGRLSDNDFATLLRETKRFAETRWSPKMRRFDASFASGVASPVFLREMWAGNRPKVAIHASDGQGLGETDQENAGQG